jgi:RNA polymerase sigma-70 factor, ECF subfamily
MVRHLVNEGELVSAAQSGDREAFSTLVTSCYQPTFRLAIGILRNREDAEDALQDAMLKAYSNLKQFQGNSRFYTWIARITINEALMMIRRRHGDRELALDEMMESDTGFLRRELEDWSNYPEKTYAQEELRRILEDALRRLSPRLCSAFRLRNVEELSVKETGARLGLSTNGVKSRVSRARSRLQKRLRHIFHCSDRCSSRSVKSSSHAVRSSAAAADFAVV